MYKMILGLALLGASAMPAQAATYNAFNMTASSSTFTPYDPGVNTLFPTTSWTNTQNSDANLVGGYVNLGAVSNFFGLPMYLYTGTEAVAPMATP